VLTELDRGRRLGWHTGAQLYASIDGIPVLDLAVGDARPAVPMTTTTIVEWASATKPLICTALAILWQRGLLTLDDLVRGHLPEFVGKDEVTIKHLLIHTADLTTTLTGIAPAARYVADICASPAHPGRCAYNSIAMWLVAEIVARLADCPFDDYLRDEIFTPATMTDCWLAMPSPVYAALEPRLAILPGISRSGTAAWVTWGRPTGGIHGPINQLARFYESLPNLLAPATLAAMTHPHIADHHDETLNAQVTRGLGFLLASSNPSHAYGNKASPRTFGHGGQTWSTAFTDATHNLTAALYLNGPATPAIHAIRLPRVLNALYADL
jgi:CubicO group peptidase (beta-lactamase class C family)